MDNQLPHQSPPPPSPVKQTVVSNTIFLCISGVVLFVLGIGTGYMIKSRTETTTSKVSQPITTIAPTTSVPSPTPTPTPGNVLTEYTSKKLPENSFKAYTISYPFTWSKNLQRDGETVDILTLSKNGYSIEIWQGPTGGSGCIFEGEMPDGPYGDYRKTPYTEIQLAGGTLRRIQVDSEKPDQLSYAFCGKTTQANTFGIPTYLGAIAYHVPLTYDPQMLEEMDAIIKTLKESPTQ